MATEKLTSRIVDNELRARFAGMIIQSLSALGEDIALAGNGVMNIPTLDANGDESAIEISIKVPKGARKEGGGYEGYDYMEARTNYATEKAEAEEKAKATADKKAAKIAKDEAARQAKADKAKAKEAKE